MLILPCFLSSPVLIPFCFSRVSVDRLLSFFVVYFCLLFRPPLSSSWSWCDVFVQEMSVAAIAATAVSAGESFLPYMATTCNMLGPLMTLQEENMLNVRIQHSA